MKQTLLKPIPFLCLLSFACSGAQKIEETEDTATSHTDPQEQEPSLFINEILAKSDTTEDWLELYNAHSEEIDISGFLLQDSAQSPWALPEGTRIEPQGFIIIWADDAAQEGLHAPFKLSKDGEELTLLYPDGTSIDHVSFPPLEPEESYARIEDGGMEWEIQDQGTPGESNED